MSDSAPKRGRGRPKTVDRDQVALAALKTYWSEGVHALSLNEMCRRVGISKPALYREFGGEDGLMEAALGRYRGLAVAPLLGALRLGLSAEETLSRLAFMTTADHGLPAGCLFTKMRLATSRLGPETRARVFAIEAERIAAFEAWVRQAQALGEVSVALPPAFAARYIDAQLTLVLVQVAAGEPPERVRAQASLALGALLGEGSDRPAQAPL